MKRVRLQELPEEGVSHDPEVRKRVMLRNGEVPHLTTFAQARFRRGQRCSVHAHATMVEVYLVESGRGTITIDGTPHVMEPGVCIAVEPGELHEVECSGVEDLVVTYFGIAVDAAG